MENLDTKPTERPLHLRLIITFILLSTLPILLYAFFSAVIYLGSIKSYLPAENNLIIGKILLTQGLLIFLMAIIMVIFASSLISSSLVRPLKRLLKLTKLIGNGDLSFKLTSTSKDEVGQLTEEFNNMVDKLRQQKEDELKVSKMKSEFITIAAHQLRTPLSGIKWTLNMLINEELGSLNNEQKGFIIKTHESNERMIRLVNDMLSVDRIESGKVQYKFTQIQILDLIDNVLFEVLYEANKKNIEVRFIKNNENLPKVMMDPEHMRSAIQNLVSNAFRYTRKNGLIEIGVITDGNNLTIKIKDNGIGIPKAEQGDIFRRFFRASNAVKLETDGSGLGLYIAKSIIEKHRGKIWYESKENVGTTIFFTIPIY